ncbi:GntR family transcriptional regulator [Bifidobacterium oedipodis]|uniref:GntR family transcriptional regulator n=1 Tax=Bifidobacterium oedipodis TaxID=2675322 RepID=A0A7Y0HRW6_9BIFI|nr:GntR family transcriptional regulator [Bifidobacterium sp. DSM 109957]NMM94515.1 GntR family transcriptional regulator [Bifidobacterium sp. DSM 109957]
MLPISVNTASAAPVFDQIVAQLTGLIRTGELAAGTNLPSIRQLAGELDVAPGTVQRAYGELEHKGMIITSPGKPARVAEREQAPCETLAAVQVLVSTAHKHGISQSEIHGVISSMWDMPAPEL